MNPIQPHPIQQLQTTPPSRMRKRDTLLWAALDEEQSPLKAHSAPSRLRKSDVNVWEEINNLELAGVGMELWTRSDRRSSDDDARMSLREIEEALFQSLRDSTAAPDGDDDPSDEDDMAELAEVSLEELEEVVSREAMAEMPGAGLTAEESEHFVDAVFGAAVATAPAAILELDGLDLLKAADLDLHGLLQTTAADKGREQADRRRLSSSTERRLSDGSPTSVTALTFDEALKAQQPPNVAAAPMLDGAPRGQSPPSVALGGGRNSVERKEWTAEEDATIRSHVLLHGCRWRRIAALLPGRSDDAVRNRWSRMLAASQGGDAKPLPIAPKPKTASAAGKLAADGKPDGGRPEGSGRLAGKPERMVWTKAEDATILAGVAELGHRWNKLAVRLPGRTEHAIRNRFHRLQTILDDRTILEDQQRRAAGQSPPPPIDAPPLPPPLPPPTVGGAVVAW